VTGDRASQVSGIFAEVANAIDGLRKTLVQVVRSAAMESSHHD